MIEYMDVYSRVTEVRSIITIAEEEHEENGQEHMGKQGQKVNTSVSSSHPTCRGSLIMLKTYKKLC